MLPRAPAARCRVNTAVFWVWALTWPASFAALIDFPPTNEHLLHDVDAFQLGLGVSLLLALVTADGLIAQLLRDPSRSGHTGSQQ